MKLSEYKDEAALDLLAELIAPASEIFSDAAVRAAVESDNKAGAVSLAIKKHKKAVMAILAALDGVPVEDFHCNVLTLPLKLIELLDDPETMRLFTSAGQREEKPSSGSPTESTEAAGQ